MHQCFREHFNNHIAQPIEDTKKVSSLSVRENPEKKQRSQQSPNKLREHHPVIRENLLEEYKLREQNESAYIKNILESGDINKITNFLLEDKIKNLTFYKETLRIKTEYESEFSSANFLTPKDWSILTAIELFDKKTFEHSLGTYIVARKKIEERMIELGDAIKNEGVTLNQFYRACLFHDIGKMTILKSILNNKNNDGDWVMGFMMLDEEKQDEILVENELTIPDSIRNDSKKMKDFFAENRIRAVKIVPIKAILHEDEQLRLLNSGIDIEAPLGKIMRKHEEASRDILQTLGFPTESALAGNHHNYNHQKEKSNGKPATHSSLHISGEISSNLIHLADIQQSLNGDRSYHHKQPMLRILAFLVDDAENGIIDSDIACKWINDELRIMHPTYLKEIRNLTANHQHHDYLQERHSELEIIDDFLSDNLPDIKN